jgi:uncharacterized protein
VLPTAGEDEGVPGQPSEEFVEIVMGDHVIFPKGMSCTWDIAQAVDKVAGEGLHHQI